jgi:hypothetical protein
MFGDFEQGRDGIVATACRVDPDFDFDIAVERPTPTELGKHGLS